MSTIDPTERLGRQMARLNTTHVKFDIGAGGGAPALTAQDIAAAVGMVTPGLGQELLLHVYWPDGAKRRREMLLKMLTAAQMAEHNRREQAMHAALCQVAIAGPADKPRATHVYNEAYMARWPQIVVRIEPLAFAEPFERIRVSVLEELAQPKACPECDGRDLVDRKGNPVTCEVCLGRGTVEYGPTWRSKALGMEFRSGFTRWRDPYQWLLDLAREHLTVAERELMVALR